jgi:hypothetical protein
MTTETLDKPELLNAIDEPVSELQGLISSLDEKEINTVPYKDSWTAAQLFQHVTKSTNGMAKAIRKESKPAGRDAGERIPELKKTFLDFSIKLKSPDFIIPEAGPYEKQAVINALDKSFEQLKEGANNANLTEMIEGLPFGPITKLELLHFVLYHTQRHLHQMEKICDALKNK